MEEGKQEIPLSQLHFVSFCLPFFSFLTFLCYCHNRRITESSCIRLSNMNKLLHSWDFKYPTITVY